MIKKTSMEVARSKMFEDSFRDRKSREPLFARLSGMTYAQGKLNSTLKESRRGSVKDGFIRIITRRCFHRGKVSLINAVHQTKNKNLNIQLEAFVWQETRSRMTAQFPRVFQKDYVSRFEETVYNSFVNYGQDLSV